jgi:hypothetical protein
MKLLTKEIADRLPPLYSQEERGDEAIAQVQVLHAVDQLDVVRQRVRSG